LPLHSEYNVLVTSTTTPLIVTYTSQSQTLPTLCSRGNCHLNLPINCWHLSTCSQRCFPRGNRQLHFKIIAVYLEYGMRAQANVQIKIARLGAISSRATLSR